MRYIREWLYHLCRSFVVLIGLYSLGWGVHLPPNEKVMEVRQPEGWVIPNDPHIFFKPTTFAHIRWDIRHTEEEHNKLMTLMNQTLIDIQGDVKKITTSEAAIALREACPSLLKVAAFLVIKKPPLDKYDPLIQAIMDDLGAHAGPYAHAKLMQLYMARAQAYEKAKRTVEDSTFGYEALMALLEEVPEEPWSLEKSHHAFQAMGMGVACQFTTTLFVQPFKRALEHHSAEGALDRVWYHWLHAYIDPHSKKLEDPKRHFDYLRDMRNFLRGVYDIKPELSEGPFVWVMRAFKTLKTPQGNDAYKELCDMLAQVPYAYPEAQFQIAEMLMSTYKQSLGKMAAQEKQAMQEKILNLYTIAAKANYPAACLQMAKLYSDDKSNPFPSLLKDKELHHKYLRKAAVMGCSTSAAFLLEKLKTIVFEGKDLQQKYKPAPEPVADPASEPAPAPPPEEDSAQEALKTIGDFIDRHLEKSKMLPKETREELKTQGNPSTLKESLALLEGLIQAHEDIVTQSVQPCLARPSPPLDLMIQYTLYTMKMAEMKDTQALRDHMKGLEAMGNIPSCAHLLGQIYEKGLVANSDDKEEDQLSKALKWYKLSGKEGYKHTLRLSEKLGRASAASAEAQTQDLQRETEAEAARESLFDLW